MRALRITTGNSAGTVTTTAALLRPSSIRLDGLRTNAVRWSPPCGNSTRQHAGLFKRTISPSLGKFQAYSQRPTGRSHGNLIHYILLHLPLAAVVEVGGARVGVARQ